MKDPRIFLGVIEVAGYFQNLFLGFKKLGYDAGYLNVKSFNFNYNAYRSQNYSILNLLIEAAKKANSTQNNTLEALVYKSYYWLLKIYVFLWCLFKFDVFIYGAGSSFFWFEDYRILKFFRKKIIHVSLGSDSRPGYMNGSYKDDNNKGEFNLDVILNNDRVIISRIKNIEKYASVIINYPQHGHFHKRSFISGNYIGFPTSLKKSAPVFTESKETKIRVSILHAPTRPKAKGSIEFRTIIKELQDEGLEIEFTEITGKTNFQVIEEIRKADIVLDELYSDLALGGLGSEAACLGKPVVVGGYYSTHLKSELSKDCTPPSFYCHPSEIKATLRKLVLNKAFRENAGKTLQNFLHSNWRDEIVASRYIQLINNDFPPSWVINPTDIDYLYGWGLSEDEAKNNIGLLLKTHGDQSLHLSHNPRLFHRFLNMVSGKEYA